MRAYERLLKYVKIYTTSEEESGTTPSAQREFDLGNLLTEELKDPPVPVLQLQLTGYHCHQTGSRT